MIDYLNVEHYKSISGISLKLSPVTVLVGRNSVGKSNIIDSLIFVRDCLEHGVEAATSDRYGIDSIIQWSPTKPFHMSINISVYENKQQGYYSIRLSSKKREPVLISEYAFWEDTSNGSLISFSKDERGLISDGYSVETNDFVQRIFGFDDNALILPKIRMVPTEKKMHFGPLFRNLVSIHSYSIYPNIIRDPQKPSKDLTLSTSGDNITSVLKSMVSSNSSRAKHGYNEIVSSMRTIIPNLERILVRNLTGLMWLAFEVSEGEGRSHQLNTMQVSDGALRILGILVALYQPFPPDIIAIEEPEQNLHPGALSLLAEAVNEQSRQTKIIITTHSPHLIDYFDIDNIRTVVNSKSGTKIGTVSEYQRDSIKSGLMSASEIMSIQGLLSDTE